MNTVKMGKDFMVRIPKFKLSEVIDGASDTVHPAFIVGGKEVDEVFISKYQNVIFDGVPYSLPYQKPETNIRFDNAVNACRSKGDGWHLMTNAEWAAIALWCLKNGTLPHGNTRCGKYHADDKETGFCYDGWRTLTGSGPDTWAHDHTEDGIHDLCGNIFEWVGGVRLRKGNLQIVPNNDAVLADLSQSSKAWEDTGYGYLIEDDITLVKAEDINDGWGGTYFKDIKTDESAPELLKALALIPPVNDMPNGGYFWADNEEDESLCYRGGICNGNEDAGVFYAYLFISRATADVSLGFRSAFVNL